MSGLVLLPTFLALVAEAAWTSVVAGLLQAFVLRDPSLSIPALLLAAVAGVAAARVLGRALGERWPHAAVALAVAAGAIGWLASPEVRAILGARGLPGAGEALVANPGGWVAAVAFVRGIAHARVPPDPRAIGNLLGLGVPGLALTAILGGMVADPWRGRFLEDAQLGVVVFLVAGILTLALSRLSLVGSGSGIDWRHNPAWLALLVVLLSMVAVVAVAASLTAGPTIAMLLGAAIPSLLLLGLVVGFDLRSVRVLAISVLIAVTLAAALRLVGARPTTAPPPAGTGITTPTDPAAVAPLAVGVLAVLLIVGMLAILVLARLWMRRPRDPGDDLVETRWIDHGGTSERPPAGRGGRRRFGRGAPADAVAAYRALIEDLAPRPRVRRTPGETPAEHAGRLRREGTGGLSLDLLAADYGLVRYGGLTLTTTEDRRAVRRAGLLRRRLTGADAASPTARRGASPAEAERPGDAGTPGKGPGARSRFRIG